MAYTGMTQMPARVRTYYERSLLKEARGVLCHDMFAQKKSIKKKNGDQMLFRSVPDLAARTVPIDGITDPEGQSLSKNDITATLAKYGGVIYVEDEVDFTVEDPIMTVASERAGRQGGVSIEILNREVLNAGTSLRRANGVANRTDIIARVAVADLNVAVRALKNANAERFTKMIQAGTGVSTKPIPASFFAITHPNVSYTLVDLDGFIPVEQYSKQIEVYPNEIGAHKSGIRFLETTYAKSWAGGGAAVSTSGNLATGGYCDVYSILIFAQDAYGTISLDGEAMKTIIKDFGEAGSKIDLFATVGWKAFHVCKIIDETKLYRIECAVAA